MADKVVNSNINVEQAVGSYFSDLVNNAIEISEIGFPPEESGASDLRLKMRSFTLPVVKLVPIEFNLNLHALGTWRTIISKNAVNKYRNICQSFGLRMSRSYLKLFTLDEGSISDGLSNSYGSSFLGSALSVYESSTLPEIFRLTGSNETIAKMSLNTTGKLQDAINSVFGSNFKAPSNFVSGLASLMTGLRLDIPNVWQGSSSNMSYSFTVRLYNPNPYSDQMFMEKIWAPIAALYILASPKSYNGVFYDRPFGVRVESPGRFAIKEGVITSLSIVKGGDNNDYHYNQRPSSVDIRISVESIYPTMLLNTDIENLTETAAHSKTIAENTKHEYEQELKDSKGVANIGDIQVNDETGPPTVNEYLENLKSSYDYTEDILSTIPVTKNVPNVSNTKVVKDEERVSQDQVSLAKRVKYDYNITREKLL